MLSAMVDLPESTWFAVGFIALASALAILHTLGAAIQNEQRTQDLRARVARLRSQYRKRLAEAQDQDILIVDEAPPATAPGAA